MISLKDYDREYTDFRRDFTETLMEFDNGRISFPVHIKNIEFTSVDSGVFTGYTFHEGKPANVKLTSRDHDMRPWFPDAGVYNVDNTIVLLQYWPSRQYKRGFCESVAEVRIPQPFYSFGYSNELRTDIYDARIVNSLHNVIDIPFEQGVEDIMTGKRNACRLFDQFYMMLHPTEERNPILVFCDNSYIGKVVNDTIILKGAARAINDVFRDKGYRIA